jgi:PKD repeat protein
VTAEFFANGQSIGMVGNNVAFPNPPIYPGTIGITITEIFITAHPDSLPDLRSYSLLWRPQPGAYTLTVKATDDHGNTAVSDPVNVTVIPTPVVSVEASVSMASSAGPGIFTITRTGDTNDDLSVPFFLLGNAQDGVDYAEISNSVTIPAGQFSTDIAINPLVYRQGNTRAVRLQLVNYLIPGGGGPGPVPEVLLFDPPFLVGSPGAATIYLKANERDPHRPIVRITRPDRGQPFAAGSNISITADTFDRDTDVSVVEFFDRTTKLGEISATTTTLPGQHIPFYFIWPNAPVGGHVLRARATDSQGKTQVSRPVRIQVSAP